jgi:hypothetical protein
LTGRVEFVEPAYAAAGGDPEPEPVGPADAGQRVRAVVSRAVGADVDQPSAAAGERADRRSALRGIPLPATAFVFSDRGSQSHDSSAGRGNKSLDEPGGRSRIRSATENIRPNHPVERPLREY